MLAEAAAEEAAAAAALGVRRVGAVEDLRCLDENLDGGLGRRRARSAPHCAWNAPCMLHAPVVIHQGAEAHRSHRVHPAEIKPYAQVPTLLSSSGAAWSQQG
jgi:hypothetical protein